MKAIIDLSGRRRSLAVAIVAALASSCGDGLLSPSMALGTEWRLASFERKDMGSVSPPDPSRFTLRLGSDNSLGVRADCNVCGGSYALSGARISVSLLVCTQAYCTGTAPLDSEYSAALQDGGTLELREDSLTLRTSQATLRFVR